MCGICGFVSFREGQVTPDRLARACEALRHRGPDHGGVWSDGPVGFGATRLAILDLTVSGNQPMHDASGRYHLVHNGEIYNFRELRQELAFAGESFLTETDTEVILAAIARWGVEAFHRFNGMWAIGFYDTRAKAGLLARDRFGIKPMLYSQSAERLMFASELTALRRLGPLDESIDPHALQHHLQFGYIPHPHTIYRGARRLPPGHYLRFGATSAEAPEAYYDPVSRLGDHATAAVAPEWSRMVGGPYAGSNGSRGLHQEVRGELVRRIREAVVARRVSDVPIGAFLSGGLDSTIIVSHLAAASPRPVETFCVGYEGQRFFDERRFARLVAERFGTEHHEVVLAERDVLEAIPRILDHIGEPFGDSSLIPTALVSQFARTRVTVALSGDGGDELFGGYWRYLGHQSIAAYNRLPGFLRRSLFEPMLANMAASKSGKAANAVRRFRKLLRARDGDHFTRHVNWSRIVAPEAEAIFVDRELPAAFDRRLADLARDMTEGMPVGDPMNRVLAFDLRYPLPGDMLHKVDLASMMHSLEVRVPFLDYRVVELALALPSHDKVRGGLRKQILIEAYRGEIPDEILDRPKQGFEVPIGEFLRGPMRALFHDVVTPPAVDSFDSLSFTAVERVFADHVARRADHTDLLFAILSLCWWRKGRAA